jgi:thymidylate synthase (FAD)
MKLIKPSFEILPQQSGEVGMLKHIETCGRVAWKSEDKTTDDSYIKFIDMLKGVNHGSVLEHGTVYLYVELKSGIGPTEMDNRSSLVNNYLFNKYSKVIKDGYKRYITTNYRVLVENTWLDDLKYQCEPTEYHEKRATVRFVCDRGVSHEFVRHRVFSFTQESTRYCNYSKEKFGNELVFIEPCWDMTELSHCYYQSLRFAEETYLFMLNNGWKPQQARAVLPNSLKTELIMTGFVSDWKHFFMLRTAKGAHPQAQELVLPLQEEFKKLKLI